MTGSTERSKKAGFIYHQINWCTYLLYRLLTIFIGKKEKPRQNPVSPLLVTGLFRSGTTITTQLLSEMGFSLGPKEDLLLGRGWRKDQNPEGFLENYLIMELSMYLFHKTNSWGDAPPTKEIMEEIYLTDRDRHPIAKFSMVDLLDDRISNFNKLRILSIHNVLYPSNYISEYFDKKPIIKNPHFAVQMPYFRKVFKDPLFLFVFKKPSSAIRSARTVSKQVDYETYYRYYEEACMEHRNSNKNIIFFSHENLCESPQDSIRKLAEVFSAEKADLTALTKLVTKDKTTEDTMEAPDKVNLLYLYMRKHCINPL